MTTDYKTLRVPADDYERAKQSKRDSETWGEFLQRCTDSPPEIREFVEAPERDGVDTEALVADLTAELPDAVADAVEARLR